MKIVYLFLIPISLVIALIAEGWNDSAYVNAMIQETIPLFMYCAIGIIFGLYIHSTRGRYDD